MASAAVIAAGFRLDMNAPRDAADTLSDCGRLERGRFITWGRRVNLITRGALEVQASEQGTTPSGEAPPSDPPIARPQHDRDRRLFRKSSPECPRGSVPSTCCE